MCGCGWILICDDKEMSFKVIFANDKISRVTMFFYFIPILSEKLNQINSCSIFFK